MEKKTQRIKFWLTDKELKQIDRKAKKLGMNRSEYIRCLIANCKLVHTPDIDYESYYNRLKDISDKINDHLKPNAENRYLLSLCRICGNPRGISKTAHQSRHPKRRCRGVSHRAENSITKRAGKTPAQYINPYQDKKIEYSQVKSLMNTRYGADVLNQPKFHT